jgi:hypothetical protein
MSPTKSLAQSAHPEGTRERGICSGCGTTTKTLTAPRPNVGHGYRGPIYCLPCNPRFFTLDAHWSCLERMVRQYIAPAREAVALGEVEDS